jgi:hypothetical protein
MCKHISKAIIRCSAAIHLALATYNQLAPLQNPPRPILQFSDIASYTFLSDFELLKYSRHDILSKSWTLAANHEVTIKYFKILCAHEEIERLNLKIKCLVAWVDFEHTELLKAASRLETSDCMLATEIHAFHGAHQCVNNVHRCHLQTIYRIEGYSGSIPAEPTPANIEGTNDLGSDQLEVNDDLHDEISCLAEFLDNIL